MFLMQLTLCISSALASASASAVGEAAASLDVSDDVRRRYFETSGGETITVAPEGGHDQAMAMPEVLEACIGLKESQVTALLIVALGEACRTRAGNAERGRRQDQERRQDRDDADRGKTEIDGKIEMMQSEGDGKTDVISCETECDGKTEGEGHTEMMHSEGDGKTEATSGNSKSDGKSECDCKTEGEGKTQSDGQTESDGKTESDGNTEGEGNTEMMQSEGDGKTEVMQTEGDGKGKKRMADIEGEPEDRICKCKRGLDFAACGACELGWFKPTRASRATRAMRTTAMVSPRPRAILHRISLIRKRCQPSEGAITRVTDVFVQL